MVSVGLYFVFFFVSGQKFKDKMASDKVREVKLAVSHSKLIFVIKGIRDRSQHSAIVTMLSLVILFYAVNECSTKELTKPYT